MRNTTYELCALQKSKTFNRYVGQVGTCSNCQEPTSILSPCCNEAVEFEGASLTADTLWNQIENEIEIETKESEGAQ